MKLNNLNDDKRLVEELRTQLQDGLDQETRFGSGDEGKVKKAKDSETQDESEDNYDDEDVLNQEAEFVGN